MARVRAQRAGKDYPEHGIKKGATYYKWSLRFSHYGRGVTYRSATHPRASQTTSSAFWQETLSIGEELEDLTVDRANEAGVEDIISLIRDHAAEQQDKFDNMPEGLQQGSTGELLQERADSLEEWASDLESIDWEDRDPEELLEEIQGCQYQGS